MDHSVEPWDAASAVVGSGRDHHRRGVRDRLRRPTRYAETKRAERGFRSRYGHTTRSAAGAFHFRSGERGDIFTRRTAYAAHRRFRHPALTEYWPGRATDEHTTKTARTDRFGAGNVDGCTLSHTALIMRLRVFLLVAFWTVFAPTAHAQSKGDADKLKVAADAAMDNLHYAEALDGYTKAYAISHDPRFLYNMGRALGALGQYPEAVNQLERFRLEAPTELKARVPQLEQLITDFKRHVSTLTIKCNVAGSRVLVRDKAVGQTPLGDLQLDAGPAVVEVDADGYTSQSRQVTLPEGNSLELVFDLVKVSPLGVLIVRSVPAATSVLVDGRGLGGTPLETSVMPGPHALLLARDGYRDLAVSALVERGQRRELDLRLEKTPSIFSRWWFWTIVGVVVASGVATGIAATTERPADSGSIPPGQVRGP